MVFIVHFAHKAMDIHPVVHVDFKHRNVQWGLHVHVCHKYTCISLGFVFSYGYKTHI